MKSPIMEVFVLCLALALKTNAQTPLITSQPLSATNNLASAAAFTVVAANAATYQWQFNGIPITNSPNVTGATSNTLSLDDLTTNQAGSYTVVVTSSDNISVTSAPPAVLTITNGTLLQWTISTFPDGGSSNFLVALFDYDKPATVENFIHYVTSGVFSNMFFFRDATNFVLQGGYYVSADRTTNQLNFSHFPYGTNIFPSQVDSEFNVGPLIHNTFGTLAMAKVSGEPDSASSSFFFNLADNSTGATNNLDDENSGFTVFGRILFGTNSGSNILQYFNTLSTPTNGIYYGASSIPTLPVNFSATNYPTDANLFYCDFDFITPPPVDTTPPTVSIASIETNVASTNLNSFTVTGTASDNVGLAEVFCVLTSLSGVNSGGSQTNAASGTTNWSLTYNTNEPGIYLLTAYAQDGAGNLSAPATEHFTNLAELTIITNTNGELTTNQQYLFPGQQYSVTAPQVAGEVFLDWQIQGVTSLDPVQTFSTETNLTITVTYLLTNLPSGLAITSPAAGSTVTMQSISNELAVSGTLPGSVTVTQVTCQLFYQSNAATAAIPAVINGANWSLTVSNLAGGLYTIIVVAEDASGEEGLVSENFTALVPPVIITQPQNVSTLDGSTAYFSVTASNAVSYQWQWVGTGPIPGATNATLVLPNVTTNMSGYSYSVLITAQDGETTNSSPAVLTVVTGTLVQITFSGFPGGGSSNVLVQLFDHEKPATVANFLHYITPSSDGSSTNLAYSNMIWDMCIPGNILQGGDYAASDRTNGTPPVKLQYIHYDFTADSYYSPQFASQVDNEYNAGPIISNTFGTLAMAKTSGESNSAANAFFFNLADNSATLDVQNGGYTVFGRVISNSAVLQYFNTLSKPTNGIFDSTLLSDNAALPDLPVNDHGWGRPANSNLFFADFTLLSTYNADTNSPTVLVASPTNGQTMTSPDVVFQGTATDDVALANVSGSCEGSNFSSNYFAIGTSNWTMDLGILPPGTYTNVVTAQDGAGNLSTDATNIFVVPRFPFTNSVIGNGSLSTNLTLTNTTVGSNYSISAKPGSKGSVFVKWVSGTNACMETNLTFTMQNGMQWTAYFISNTMPANGISFSYPVENAQLTNTNLTITGIVNKTLGVTNISCQIFSRLTGFSVTTNMVINNSASAWSTPLLSLPPGYYTAQAIARDSRGRTRLFTRDFAILTPLTVIQYGRGSVTIPNGSYLLLYRHYTIQASPAPGQKFLSWDNGQTSSPLIAYGFYMTEGLTFTVTFISNSLSSPAAFTFVSPTANSQVTNPAVTLGGKIASSFQSPQVVCQLFQNDAPLTGFTQAAVATTIVNKVTNTTWTLPVTNLTMGFYNAVAILYDASGKTAFASDPFVVNFFPNIAGAYNGLFFNPTNVSNTNAGRLSFVLRNYESSLSGENFGFVSGNLAFPLKNFPVSTPITNTGSTTVYFSNALTGAVSLSMNFDLTNFSGKMTGSVTQGGNQYPLAAYRAVSALSSNTTPSPGNFVLSLQPELPTNGSINGPLGDSFAALSVSKAGNLAVDVGLADNTTPFSFSTGVFTNGVWPLYASLNNGNGILIGWETNAPSGDSAGTLVWIRSANKGVFYPGGVSESFNSVGVKFAPPALNTNYQIVLGGGSLANATVTNMFSFKAAGSSYAIVPAANATNKLTGTLLSTGVFSKGSILNPLNNKTLPFSGAFFGPANGGAGFTLDAGTNTGWFTISLAPE